MAYLSYSSGEFDARSFRMAASAIRAGYEVTIYARWTAGQPPVERHDGYRLIRAPADWRLAVPGLRNRARRRMAADLAEAARLHGEAATADGMPKGRAQDDSETVVNGVAESASSVPAATAGPDERSLPWRIAGFPRRVAARLLRPLRRWRRIVVMFPLGPLGWAEALEAVVEPADIWHGMWTGSLPALARMRARHGGRTIYDSRDVYMLSRDFSRLEWPMRPILVALERRWARAADRVLTVNEPYADLLVQQLGVPRPPVVMNCPESWVPPRPSPDLIRAAIGLTPDTTVVLYQGQMISERGIEQAMDAILEVPNAALVLLGFGAWTERYRTAAAAPPYLGKVFLLPPVRPRELLAWTACADIMVMPIQPTTVNHRFTTPQKLFEAIAAGVPVVASELPGMAAIVNSNGVGEVCDPTSPAAIASAITRLAALSPDERAALRAHILRVAHAQLNWEAQTDTLFGLYRELTVRGREQ